MQPDSTLAFLISQGFSKDILVRFWKKVNKDGPIPEHRPELGPCWVWTAGIATFGYGIIAPGRNAALGRAGRRGIAAHRVSWLIHCGIIPEQFCVLHKCDNPLCVRAPDHLFLGTKGDNWRDMLAKDRQVVTVRKLTDDQAREVLKMAETMKDHEIAAKFNVNPGMIWFLRKRLSYKHLDKQKPGEPLSNPRIDS